MRKKIYDAEEKCGDIFGQGGNYMKQTFCMGWEMKVVVGLT
jgi:hypothetical protein